MDDKRIQTVCNSLELKSIQDIQDFSRFASFYGQFIPSLGRMTVLLISVLWTTNNLIANK